MTESWIWTHKPRLQRELFYHLLKSKANFLYNQAENLHLHWEPWSFALQIFSHWWLYNYTNIIVVSKITIINKSEIVSRITNSHQDKAEKLLTIEVQRTAIFWIFYSNVFSFNHNKNINNKKNKQKNRHWW